jgi:hypothetical protein
VPVVVSHQKDERLVIEKIAAQRSALIQVGQDYRFATLGHSLEGQSFRLEGG